jgi:hypothetical protein
VTLFKFLENLLSFCRKSIFLAMAYNQQQQPQQQQYIVAGQMLNMGDQVVQQQQYIAVDQHAMAAPIGKITLNKICIFLTLYK